MESFPGMPVQWTDQAVHIKDFSAKNSVPNVVKVIKGQYRNIGVAKSVHSELYLHNVQTMNKILAEAIKLKDGGKTKVVASEQKYSLPLSYKGWFEVLSQDGKSVKAIQNVQELARFYPPTCLVRDNMKGFVNNGTSELSLEHTRTVSAGEVLTLSGEMWVPFPMGKTMGKRRILKCTDSKGRNVFFGLEQKGIFSPIAGQTNISGVHSIKGILDKFRMPVLVRLVHGVIPSKMEKGFTGVFRFMNVYSDENAFVCPLRRDAKMVSISTREPLKVVAVQDYNGISKLEDIQIIQRKCMDMMESYLNSIHILISMPDVSMFRAGDNSKTVGNKNSVWMDPTLAEPAPSEEPPARSISQDEEDLLFQEIDGIYQYVREGGVPPKPRPRPTPTRPPTQQQQQPPPKLEPSPTTAAKPAPMLPVSPPSAPKGLGFGDMFEEIDDDPLMEIKIQHLDLGEEEEETTTLRRQDSYSWEEPIYEPLEKIREHKRKSEAMKGLDVSRPVTVASGFDTPPDSLKNNDGRSIIDEPLQPLSAASPITPMGIESGIPVANLRQVMRSISSSPDNARPLSLALNNNHMNHANTSAIPPPLPPKRYSSGDANSPDITSKPLPGSSSLNSTNTPSRTQGANSQPVKSSKPSKSSKIEKSTKTEKSAKTEKSSKSEKSSKTSSKAEKSSKSDKPSPRSKSSRGDKSSTGVKSAQGVNQQVVRPQSKYEKHVGLTPGNRKSFSPPKSAAHSPFPNNSSSSSGSSNSPQYPDRKVHSSPSAHGPYVAVARVTRDYQQDAATASVLVNPEIYRTGMSNGGQKLNSLYL